MFRHYTRIQGNSTHRLSPTKLIQCLRSNIKFVENWWAPLLFRVGVLRNAEIKLRSGEVVNLSSNSWGLFILRRNLFNSRGVFTYKLDGKGYVAIANGYLLWAPDIKLLTETIWEPLTKIYPREYFEHKVVVDIGAYIGDTTILFSKVYGARRVLAYEPNPTHFKALLLNVKFNKLKNVTCLNKAICGHKGEVCIEGLGAMATTTSNGNCDFTSPCDTLEDVINKYEPETIKIDCEGCEYDAILSTSPETLRKVGTYIVEVHGKAKEKDIINYMKKAGYKLTKTTYTLIVPNKSIYAKVLIIQRKN